MDQSLKALERPQSLGDRVYLTLRDYLRSRRVPSGQPLQESTLAAQLGVSRTPVREALARLASEGLLDSDGRGFVVPTLSESDIDDIYELRLMLEPEALRQVATRIKDRKQLAPIRDELQTMTAADAANDAAAFMDANYRYRTTWIALVPNRRLVRAIELYADHVRYLRSLTLGDREARAVVLKGLRRLASALSTGDGDAAASAMRDHLLEAKRILRESMSNENSEGS